MHADPVIFLFRLPLNLLEPKQAEAEEEEGYDVILSEAKRSRRTPWQNHTLLIGIESLASRTSSAALQPRLRSE
jgi:hypothetical protein